MTKRIYGNKATSVAHNSKKNDSCRQAEIKPANLAKFASPDDALEAGFRLCKRCRWEA